MNTTPTTSPTAPSAGAVRAAKAVIREEHRVFLSDNLRDKYIYFLAHLIDRETRAKELLAACKQAAESDSNIALASDGELIHAAECGSEEVQKGARAVLALRREIRLAEGRA